MDEPKDCLHLRNRDPLLTKATFTPCPWSPLCETRPYRGSTAVSRDPFQTSQRVYGDDIPQSVGLDSPWTSLKIVYSWEIEILSNESHLHPMPVGPPGRDKGLPRLILSRQVCAFVAVIPPICWVGLALDESNDCLQLRDGDPLLTKATFTPCKWNLLGETRAYRGWSFPDKSARLWRWYPQSVGLESPWTSLWIVNSWEIEILSNCPWARRGPMAAVARRGASLPDKSWRVWRWCPDDVAGPRGGSPGTVLSPYQTAALGGSQTINGLTRLFFHPPSITTASPFPLFFPSPHVNPL